MLESSTPGRRYAPVPAPAPPPAPGPTAGPAPGPAPSAAAPVPPVSPYPGARIGRYTVLGRLGDGVLGPEYRAEDGAGRAVVLRLLPPVLAKADEVVSAFVSEARACAAVKHPAVVRLLLFGKDEAAGPFIATEHFESEPASAAVAARGPMSPREATRVAHQIATALSAVHGCGVTHRDVRPANILRGADGTVRLAGLGLAFGAEELQVLRLGIPAATPHFAGPEQFGTRAVDHRADVYSLGAAYYFLLTGRPPFEADTSLQIFHKHRSEPVPPAPMPSECLAVIGRAMAKKPADRYPAAAAMAADLAKVFAGMKAEPAAPARADAVVLGPPLPAPAEGPGGPISVVRPARRSRLPAIAWFAASAVALLATLVAVTVLVVKGLAGSGGAPPKAEKKPHVEETDETTDPSDEKRRIPEAVSDGTDPVAAEYAVLQTAAERSDRMSRAAARAAVQALREFADRNMGSPDARHRGFAELARASADRHWDDSVQILRGHVGRVFAAAYFPDGRTLATGGEDRTIKLWDPETGQLLASVQAHQDPVTAVAVSKDGKTIVSASLDRTVKLWAVEADNRASVKLGHAPPLVAGHGDVVHCVAFSPDGSMVASGSGDKLVKLWDAKTGRLLRNLTGSIKHVQTVTFSPDGKTVAAGGGDKAVRFWDAETGELRKTLDGHTNWVDSLAFGSGGGRLAAGGRDKTVHVWRLSDYKLELTLRDHRDRVRFVAFTPDRKQIVSGCYDGSVRVWDAHDGRLRAVLRGHGAEIDGGAVSPDGRTAATAGFDGTVRIWNLP